MELTKKRAKENLSKLIEKFEKELSGGRIKEYNEEATKTSFIQPFLKDVLGWDVNDRNEVSPEEKISRGRVDYGLWAGNKIRMFVEAKPPKADLNKHIEQVVQYGYNRQSVPFILLTDFEELKLFDVTVKPDSRNPRKGLKIDLRWDEYLEHFEKLWLLSKESIIHRKLNDLLLEKPKERFPVDKAILDDLKRWREELAKDIFKNNLKLFHSGDPQKDADYLKEITQRILDRIIFMRSCEDRDLVHRRSLKDLLEERTETVGTNTMIFLREEFKHYNIIFDSDLFRPQEWENGLDIDFKVMKNIVLETYNPYQFDVIPLEVLGNIYEQYLGYTIRLTDHQVKYELKPEIRKAGGIYYTPEYVVDYIVKNTVGKLVQKLTLSKVKKLRILDPACGSGSFLIRAYDEMLHYYKNKKKQQKKTQEKQGKLDLRGQEVEPVLRIDEKAKILLEHIFGVDIDEQAVEVTKLSLMLKMLDGEYGLVPGRAVLPMLDKNIRCGNSLIAGDTLELKKYFGEDWYEVKPFNWNDEFKRIMVEEDGFDTVIGNPPYGMISDERSKNYFVKHFETPEGRFDNYELFIERAIKLCRPHGLLGYIVPSPLLSNLYTRNLRRYILDRHAIHEITNLSMDVFSDPTIHTCIIILARGRVPSQTVAIRRQVSTIQDLDGDYDYSIKQRGLGKNKNVTFDIFLDPVSSGLMEKLLSNSRPLGEICFIRQCIKTGKDEAYVRFFDKTPGNPWKPTLRGRSISRYTTLERNLYVKYGLWLARNWKNKSFYETPKIAIRETGDRIIATLDLENRYFLSSLYAIYPKSANEPLSLLYILGLLNSNLATYFIKMVALNLTKGAFTKFRTNQLARLPIRSIHFSDIDDKADYGKIVALVEVMIDLNRKIQTAKGGEKDQLERQVEKSEREIDEGVYKLYGISENEKKVIEGR
ncbi:MAG: hypothetical protein A2157_12010 [Deltaproteobacteria bacterium RBG_16_47_11]|nr:MAG: hypothetical protein A2157_12010 [Deltaproteobacteria bacterium RBG_16_47_11]